MEKSLKNKKFLALAKGLAGFASILFVMLVVFSCNNLLVRNGGSLVISTPGARSASASSYTIEIQGSNGTTQSKTVAGGTTVQFDDLIPDTYDIVVEGKNEANAIVLYGTSSATVTAGKTASADVDLMKGVSDSEGLVEAVAAGGTVYIFESIDVEKTLSISTDVSVIILPAYQDVTLKNTGDVVMFDVSAGNLTIGGGEHTITLDGNTFSKHAINIKSIGEVTLSSNAVIMNCGTASVKLQNTNYNSTYALFFLEGGTIKDNNGSGVEVSDYGTFTMNSGYIKNNNTSNGGGVSLSGSSSTLKMYGGSITGNQVTGNGAGVYALNGSLIMSGGEITDNEASGSGGGVYSQKSVAMTGGYIGGNVAVSTGNGVYSGNGSSFEMGKSAVIDKNNDVYLMKGIQINITQKFTGSTPVATITPNEYTVGTVILTNGTGDAFGLSTESAKLAVTPNPGQWFIDTSGKLQEGACVSDFASLENAISAGGTVYISKAITMERTLDINKEVTLLSTTQSVVLTGPNSGNLFTVSTGGDLTIGDTTHAITLDGNKKSSQIISVDDGGIVTLANGTITNANVSGVYINAGGTFNMTGGSITGNAASNGGGVYVNTGATFTMSGSAVVNEDNDVYLSEGTTISVSGDLSGGDIVARITPHRYNDINTGADVFVLSGSDSSILSNFGRFTVTPESSGQNYQIGYDGKLGMSM